MTRTSLVNTEKFIVFLDCSHILDLGVQMDFEID